MEKNRVSLLTMWDPVCAIRAIGKPLPDRLFSIRGLSLIDCTWIWLYHKRASPEKTCYKMVAPGHTNYEKTIAKEASGAGLPRGVAWLM